MKLKVLVDNNTYIDQYYLGEPAVSYYIEADDKKILFDTGYSDVLLRNAQKMGIDLGSIDTIVFSHGHNDHTRGFAFLANESDVSKMNVVAHPVCFEPKIIEEEEIGSPFDTVKMKEFCNLKLTQNPFKISEHLIFLGEIPMFNDFEERSAIGLMKQKDNWRIDYVMDDSALVYQDEDGIFIITGCSHSGICNIIEYAKKVCNHTNIKGVIGGFHLFERNSRLEKTISYLVNNKISCLYPCHCVSFQVKSKMTEILPVKEVGVGLTIEV